MARLRGRAEGAETNAAGEVMLFRKTEEPETVDCPVCTTGVFRTPGVKARMIADGIECGICRGRTASRWPRPRSSSGRPRPGPPFPSGRND